MLKRLIAFATACTLLAATIGTTMAAELKRQDIQNKEAALSNDGRNVDAGYLLRENFFQTNGYIGLSGWDKKNISNAHITNIVNDSSRTDDAYIAKDFASQEESVTMEFRIIQTQTTNGGDIKLKSGDEDAVSLKISDNKLYYVNSDGSTTFLNDMNFERWMGIKIVANVTDQTATVMVDGMTKAENVPFSVPQETINRVYFGIDKEGTGSYSLGYVFIYTGYSVYEDLISARKTVSDTNKGNLNLDATMRTTAAGGTHPNNAETVGLAADGNPETYWDSADDVAINGMALVANYSGQIKKINKIVLKAPYEGITNVLTVTYADASNSWNGPTEDTTKSNVIFQPTEMKTAEQGGTVIYFSEPIYARELAVNIYDPAGEYDRLTIAEFEAYYEGDDDSGDDTYVVPDDWDYEAPAEQENGMVEVYERAPFTQDGEFNSFKLTDNMTGDGVSLSHTFHLETSAVWDFDLLFEQKKDGFSTALSTDNGKQLLTYTKGDNVCLKISDDSKEYVIIKDYIANNWYRFNLKLDKNTNTLEVSVNGWNPVEDIVVSDALVLSSFEKVEAFTEDATTGSFMIDNIRIYPLIKREEVPEPEPIDTGEYMLTMQSCSLWRAGNHIGWALNQVSDPPVKPLLGWYDEGDPVAFDWQIKWLTEHGVNTLLYCWYRYDTGPGPIKETPNADELWGGQLSANYREYLNFALQFTNAANSIYGPEDFKENLVPHWIETYFKNPNYQKTADNEPIIYIYDPTWFRSELGDFNGDGTGNTNADVKAALDYFREECIKAGFGGLKIATEYRGTSETMLQNIADDGYDFSYAYTWGSPFEDATDMEVLESINSKIQLQQDTYKNIGAKTREIPTITRMLDSYIWIDAGYALDSAGFTFDLSTFKSHVEWVKNSFDIPTVDSKGTKMIMIDNWNEFQEGHYFMPTYGTQSYNGGVEGFGPLDVLRDVFGLGEYEHEDIMPLESGYGPYDKWFPAGWDDSHRPDIPESTSAKTERHDPVLTENSVLPETSFETLGEKEADKEVYTIDASGKERVNLDAALVKHLIESEQDLEVTFEYGNIILPSSALAKADKDRAIDLVFSQLIDVTDIKEVTRANDAVLSDNTAYRIAVLQGNQEILLDTAIKVTLSTDKDVTKLAALKLVYEAENLLLTDECSYQELKGTVLDGAVTFELNGSAYVAVIE